MKCLDNIYTKQIKYNAPVLYQLESLKKEYEKLLKVSNEIIKTGSFIEECYFENQSATLSDNEITFKGNLKFKTDAGNYFSSIPSSLKLNVKGTGEIVVVVGEDNKTLTFKLDENFLSEISLMIEDLNSLKEKVNSQVFDNFIGIRNTSDSKIDQIKHNNNNFQITSNDGKSLLNIDEIHEKIYSFNKELSFTDASNLTEENVASWQNKCGFERVETLYDMHSTDPNINWGYSSGITGGSDVYLPEDFSAKNYKRLEISFTIWDVPSGVVLIDLSNYYNEITRVMWSANSVENGTIYQYSFSCKYNKTTRRLEPSFWEGINIKNNTANFAVLNIKAYK